MKIVWECISPRVEERVSKSVISQIALMGQKMISLGTVMTTMSVLPMTNATENKML
jgi:hypothetical protein